MAADAPAVIAGGDINPARFCTILTTANHTVVESNSGDAKLAGISDEFTRNAPQDSGSTLHAIATDHVTLRRPGEICKLKIGSGGCTAGDFLKPDNSGQGVTAATGAVAGALAWETAVEGDLADVEVLHPTYVA